MLQEAVERAYVIDKEGDVHRAIRLYRKGLEIIYEGLQLQVPSSGLSSRVDNVASWREQLNHWQLNVQDR